MLLRTDRLSRIWPHTVDQLTRMTDAPEPKKPACGVLCSFAPLHALRWRLMLVNSDAALACSACEPAHCGGLGRRSRDDFLRSF